MNQRLLMGTLAAAALFLAPAWAEENSAEYELVVTITWSAETAPHEYPANAHMSGLIGATHNSRYVLFRDGRIASSGLELVAENGRPKILKAEFEEALRRKRLGTVIEGPNLPEVPGTIRTTFRTTADHPFVSFITMLAPSPDWFTGVADVDLRRDGEWIESVELPLWVWDSGTDNGATFTAANDDTQPRQSVRLLASRHFLGAGGLVPVGTAILRRTKPN